LDTDHLNRRRKLFIKMKAPIKAPRDLMGWELWPQQQNNARAYQAKRNYCQRPKAQRPTPHQMAAKTNTPDTRRQPAGPQQSSQPLARPAISRKSIKMVNKLALHN
jgi:hypothetical protein